MKAITHIISDNDGVNIDSEDVAMRVMDDWGSQLVHKYNSKADLRPDYIYRTYPGTSTDKIVEALIKQFNLPAAQINTDYRTPQGVATPTHLADLITLETNARFQKELKAVPGTAAALQKVRNMVGAQNMALATTSRADRMDISLCCAVDPETGKNAGLADIYPAGLQRRSGYGHSNKYDEAYQALGWDPAATLIIEDSLSGVTKARAGRPEQRVLGTVAARFYEDKEAQAAALIREGASLVIYDMADLPKAVTWLNAGLDSNAKPDFTSKVVMPADVRQDQRPKYGTYKP